MAISHKPLAVSDQPCNIPTVTGRLCTLIVVAFTLFVPTAGHTPAQRYDVLIRNGRVLDGSVVAPDRR